MACQAALPDHQDFPRTREIIVRLIKEHMAEPGADQRAQKDVDEEARETFFRPPFMTIDLDMIQ